MSVTSPRAGRTGTLAVALLALLALVAGLLPVASTARADVNTGIRVTEATLVKSSRTGVDTPGATLSTRDVAKLTFTWDATGAQLAAGDSFEIDLGTYFKNLETSITTPMTVVYDGQDVEVGSCALTDKTVTCTFSDKVAELQAAGFTSFNGTGQALLLITQATTSATADITATGGLTEVPLPGDGGGIIEPVGSYTPWTFWKYSSVINSSSTGMTWYVEFGSEHLKSLLEGAGPQLTTDGQTRQTITFTDTLGEGMDFSTDMSEWHLMMRNSAAEPDAKGAIVTNAAGEDPVTSYGDFDMSVSIDGKVATITVTGPFAEATNYRLYYPVTISSGTAVAGTEYTNKATLQGAGKSAWGTRSYAQSFQITVEMKPGFGGLAITKALDGDGAATVPADTSFPVTVDYVLPAPAGVYSGWTAPGTLAADGKSGTATMTVTPGGATTFQGTFPAGTVVTLNEDLSGAPAGYTWASSMTINGEETSTFTVADQVRTQVSLTNTATTVTTASPSAPATTAPAPTASGSAPAVTAPAPTTTAQTPSMPSLARTGMTVGLPLVIAVAAVAGGALLLRRRRS
ncbi:MAG: DUF5979 domain-containing protein [Actinomyces sp.]|uniref:DUF7926 domain-containing protein n=1 Tax=Actinomyces sp. TaxID=29317 RepID=UPI0026DB45AE|nr:DUF5979 domain-containing protein [Actinomyces sp.]MDO4243211.1 DUF5979 domain-containing protein [Actinomyces sp.]